MKINIIASVGRNLEIGKNNKLIWHISEDLKYFKEKTMGKTIVMGEKTYFSIGHALSGRNNIVISFDKKDISGVKVLNNYKDVFLLNEDEIFIIGGSSIYKLFLPFSSNLYLTEIDDSDSNADSYFPSFDKTLYDKIIIDNSICDNISYSFVVYKRKG